MGTSQSTREVEIKNDDLLQITLSQDAMRRLSTFTPGGGGKSGGFSTNMDTNSLENMRQEIENEYRQRILDRSSHNLRVHSEEFARAIQDVEAKFIKHTGSPVCEDLQQSVLKCYQNNLRQPLNCSAEVQAFSTAVERERRNALLASKQKS